MRRTLTNDLAEHLRPHLSPEDVDLVAAFVFREVASVVGWRLGTKSPLTADQAYERFRSRVILSW
ncbi:hypothetical protein ALI144C_08670 [Actinosynnema sp. ALI-1.44]|uniref:hypothetical protein n=1 Tax=Actinosynnema sp. ALI-1.44 TaxID=1933779 RepID=UPI00097CBAF1|nr:hypothetical protein [Actinosynnema sp. ALI-1.44]ONI87460.1 hypothetical protein ALI144C_08670 [Actinosynnema sp. ALI-1.44]